MSSLNEIHDILNSFKEGREEGFSYFFNSCYKPLYFFASRYVKDHAAAEDIITESFIKLWDKREIFENESGIKGYLYKSVYHGCIRWLENQKRYQKHHSILKHQIEITEKAYLHNIIKSETIYLLKRALDTLPDRCRQVFIKMYLEEKSVKEIAAEMNTTISTVKNQQSRGIKLLKPKLSSNR